MSSIVVSGDVSGSVTLSAPSAAGSVVVTLPSASGTMAVTGGAPSFGTLTVTGNTNLATTSGNVLLNTTTARTAFFNGSNTPLMQIEGTGFSTSSESIIRNSNDASGSFVILGKTRGTAVGDTTIVSTGDVLGVLSFQGSDGTELVESARIGSAIDAAPGANDMPGNLFFSTTADGASSSTERMRIDSNGSVGIGTSSPNKSGSNKAMTLNAALGNYFAFELSTGDVGRWYINADANNVYDTCLNSTARKFYVGGSERGSFETNGNFQFNSGYGSSAVAYGCRAWVNFNGTGTIAIRGSGNISSLTDNGTLSYRINFTNAMPDVNYNYVFGGTNVNDTTGTNYTGFYATTGGTATTSLAFVGLNIYNGGANQSADNPVVNVSIFR